MSEIIKISPNATKVCDRCGVTGLAWITYRTKGGNSVRLGSPDGTFHTCGYQFNSPSKSPKPIESKPDTTFKPDIPKFDTPSPITSTNPPIQPVNTPESIALNEKPAIQSTTAQVPEIYNLIKSFVQQDILDAVSQIEIPVTRHDVVITHPNGEQTTITGQHEKFSELLSYLSVGLNVMLVGPAGSGKTYAAEQCAKALNLNFNAISVGPQTSKSDLMGYMSASGAYISTVVRDAFENGGILLIDEIDAGNAGVLTVLNAMLANNVCGFPDGMKQKHADFRVVAAANTFGLGANRQYVGRNQLDAATLDRFVGINWDYDKNLETSYAGKQTDWLQFIWNLRNAASTLGLRVIFGSRRVQQGARMLDAGIDIKLVMESTVWFGVSTDDKAKLIQATR